MKITHLHKLLLSATTMTMLVTVVGAGHKFF
jgi:hypothetical protein